MEPASGNKNGVGKQSGSSSKFEPSVALGLKFHCYFIANFHCKFPFHISIANFIVPWNNENGSPQYHVYS